jgi:uncharacterized protein YrrD
MNVLYFIAVQMKIAFQLKPIDVKAKEKIDAATDISYESESYHLRFFLINNSLWFQIQCCNFLYNSIDHSTNDLIS